MRNLKKVLSITAAAAMAVSTVTPVSVFAESEETFKIGVIGPMTGDYAQYGNGVYNAAKIAADEINANGGFNGYQVEILDAGDDQGDPEKAVNAYNDLLDKGMQMLCGTVTSGSCIAVGAEAAESTFMFTPSATAIESENKGYIAASLGVDSGYVPYTAYCAKKSFLKNNPEIIQSFTNAIQKGLEFVNSHNSSEIAAVIAPQFKETDIQTLTKIVERYKSQDTWKNDTIFEESSFSLLTDILKQAGELDENVPYNKLVTTDFSKKAVK